MHLEYWQDGWKPVTGVTRDAIDAERFIPAGFPSITTRCLSAVFDASHDQGR